MNRKEVVLTGGALNNILFNRPQEDGTFSGLNSEFKFEWITSPTIAVERTKRLSGNPNYRPVPFVMPSAKWGYGRYMLDENYLTLGRLYQASEEEKFQATNPPVYRITNHTALGGRVGEYNALIENETVDFDIYIKDTTFDETLIIRFLFSSYTIQFTDCTFKKGVSLANIQVDHVQFNNCVFENVLNIYNCNLNAIVLSNVHHITGFQVSIDKVQEHKVSLYQNDIGHRLGKITLDNVQIDGTLSIGSKNIESVYFNNSSAKTIDIELDQDRVDVRSEQQLTINKLRYNSIPGELVTQSFLKNLRIKDFELTGTLKKDSVLTIHSCDCNNTTIHDFSNDGKFVLNDVGIGNSLKLVDSDLAKMTFLGVTFTGTKRFDILRSNITDIVLYQTIFPDIINEEIGNLAARRDVYRQLKSTSNKQADKLNELQYDAIESSIIRRMLENTNNRDKWIFVLNDFTNRHGQDWWRAAKVQFCLTLAAFCLIQWLMGFTILNIDALDDNVASLLLFANPIHKFSELFGTQDVLVCHILAMIVDAFYRIASGYMIFQFLRAFRKYFRS